MKKVDDPDRNDIYELESSGRRFYAYGGVIGLNEDMDHPGYGFDGQLPGDPWSFVTQTCLAGTTGAFRHTRLWCHTDADGRIDCRGSGKVCVVL